MDENGFGRPLTDFKVGGRVELCPSCDRWMMGDQLGTVTSVTDRVVYVRLDKSKKRLPFPPDRLRYAKY